MVGELGYEERMEIAEALYEAERHAKPIGKITAKYPEMNILDAYAIQQMGIKLRMTGKASIVGRKIGITNPSMMERLNAASPDFGTLLSTKMVLEGVPLRRADLILPRIEGELAFIMGEELKGPGITFADVYNATSWVVPCFEICDTRVENWSGTVRDSVADNAGAGYFMLGTAPKRLHEINPRLVGMVMERNGMVLGSAAGVEVMGNPVTAVTWLANELGRFNVSLKKGDIILSGAFLDSRTVNAGDIYTLSMDGFPAITLRIQ